MNARLIDKLKLTDRLTTVAACAFVLLGSSSAFALDAAPRPQPLTPSLSPVLTPSVKYGSVREALRTGMRDYNAGDKLGAAAALEYAAGQGHSLALWKLGRMYADGDGVEHDDLKAFEYFSRLADQHADESPDSPNALVVSSAFVALGTYFLDGIKGTYVGANPVRAVEMFNYAASYFSDSNAQYNLARLYMEGTGVSQDARQAARWFNLAAEKGHHPSQALLGHMLMNGQGVPRQRAKGLMWLTLAREAATDSGKDEWIESLYEEAFAAASDNDRKLALALLEQYIQSRR
ncbi:sel1 repeat family protein [Microvirga sp. ACRRW]|uniref:tetratricopeptide repeat protein n=1 Tax=Microvirga sp. ACRRW TaxID=2918205 RepID=UPI001EF53F97|nr:tetratricopeptide repeat protein [Microvirga sp. ACRRW]MCG7394740.1 sel1 repeat family protein [Microvirga sp. ACRRW]